MEGVLSEGFFEVALWRMLEIQAQQWAASPLHYAAARGDWEEVQDLVGGGLDINTLDAAGMHCLHAFSSTDAPFTPWGPAAAAGGRRQHAAGRATLPHAHRRQPQTQRPRQPPILQPFATHTRVDQVGLQVPCGALSCW